MKNRPSLWLSFSVVTAMSMPAHGQSPRPTGDSTSCSPFNCPSSYALSGIHSSLEQALAPGVMVQGTRAVDFDGDGTMDAILRVTRSWPSSAGVLHVPFCIYGSHSAEGWRAIGIHALSTSFECAETLHVLGRDLVFERYEQPASGGMDDCSYFELSEISRAGEMWLLWQGYPTAERPNGLGWRFVVAEAGDAILVSDHDHWTMTLTWDAAAHRFIEGEWRPPAGWRPPRPRSLPPPRH